MELHTCALALRGAEAGFSAGDPARLRPLSGVQSKGAPCRMGGGGGSMPRSHGHLLGSPLRNAEAAGLAHLHPATVRSPPTSVRTPPASVRSSPTSVRSPPKSVCRAAMRRPMADFGGRDEAPQPRASENGSFQPLNWQQGGLRTHYPPNAEQASQASEQEGAPDLAHAAEARASPADVAKARWMVDREASGNSPRERKAGVLKWMQLSAASVDRMRSRLVPRQREGQSQWGSDGASDSLGYPMFRKAERRGSAGRQAPGSGVLPALPKSALVAGVVLGCAFAVGIGYFAHSQRAGSGRAGAVAAAPHTEVLGHLAVEEAPESDLAPVLADGSVLLRSAAAKSFLSMQAAARSDGVYLLPLSGFRSVEDQKAVFYGVKAARNQNIRERAKVSAPPGFSEHHTGYAIDIGDATRPGTHLEFEFENCDAFDWLQSNANRFHFELSFPPNNKQGIMYEPWHWRFVGNDHATLTFYGKMPVAQQRLSFLR